MSMSYSRYWFSQWRYRASLARKVNFQCHQCWQFHQNFRLSIRVSLLDTLVFVQAFLRGNWPKRCRYFTLLTLFMRVKTLRKVFLYIYVYLCLKKAGNWRIFDTELSLHPPQWGELVLFGVNTRVEDMVVLYIHTYDLHTYLLHSQISTNIFPSIEVYML